MRNRLILYLVKVGKNTYNIENERGDKLTATTHFYTLEEAMAWAKNYASWSPDIDVEERK